MIKSLENTQGNFKHCFLDCLGVLDKFNQGGYGLVSDYLRFILTIHFIYTSENRCGKPLKVRTCICDCHTPHFIYAINNLAVGSFKLDLVWCTKIGTAIDHSLA